MTEAAESTVTPGEFNLPLECSNIAVSNDDDEEDRIGRGSNLIIDTVDDAR